MQRFSVLFATPDCSIGYMMDTYSHNYCTISGSESILSPSAWIAREKRKQVTMAWIYLPALV